MTDVNSEIVSHCTLVYPLLLCVQFPINQPNGLQEQYRHFEQRMTPLEMICFSFDTAWDVEIGTGRFYNGSATRSSAVVDTISKQICSWVSENEALWYP